ncbi:Rz1-like lysis system protein LysC [Oceanimonas smirnovii]|uniref:Rz1-like lysis system protein LysC n=1 Tax=Oceanimonas smirnovii TaxID=264574 RepID=UPI003FD56073
MFISGCSSFTEPEPKVITQVKLLYVLPPAAYLASCEPPYTEPPKSYSEKESAVRDITWKSAFDQCAKRPDKIKEWYQSKQVDK